MRTDGKISFFGVEIERIPLETGTGSSPNTNSKNFEIKLKTKLRYIHDISRYLIHNDLDTRKNTVSRDFSEVFFFSILLSINYYS